MDAVAIGAVGTIIVGLVTAAVAMVGKRGENRNAASSSLIGGYSGLVDQVQEERDTAVAKLAVVQTELDRERSERAALQRQNDDLTAENRRLREQLADLGGTPL